MEKRTRYQNIILAILVVMTVAFGALLFYNRTQPGIQFRDGFLKQEIRTENTVYYGSCQGEKTAIYVTNLDTCTCVQVVAGERNWTYYVFPWEGKINDHAYRDDTPIIITNQDGKTIFKGYLTGGNYRYLLDENGEMDSDSFGIFAFTESDRNDPWERYTPSKQLVAELATQPDLVCRGSIGLFFLMIFFAFLLAVDIVMPELFFQLKHILDVRDPEPSDFYIAMQRLSWAILPVFLAAGYLYAVMVLP